MLFICINFLEKYINGKIVKEKLPTILTSFLFVFDSIIFYIYECLSKTIFYCILLLFDLKDFQKISLIYMRI